MAAGSSRRILSGSSVGVKHSAGVNQKVLMRTWTERRRKMEGRLLIGHQSVKVSLDPFRRLHCNGSSQNSATANYIPKAADARS